MRFFFTISFCLYLTLATFSQKSIAVSGIRGAAFISGDVSPNEARANALNDAKVNALKAAGINETVSSYQMLFTSQVKNDFTQFFSSDIQSEMQGAVRAVKVVQEKTYCKSEHEIICEVVIDGEVIRYESKPDPTFKASIDGIKGVYNNGDNLTFNVKVSQNCYLNVFNITDNGSGVFFPNTYEKNNQLAKSELYKFPMAKIDYSLGNAQKKQETNRLIFVFTKKDIAFIKMDQKQNTNSDDIFSWIYSIPPDERTVEYFALTISN